MKKKKKTKRKLTPAFLTTNGAVRMLESSLPIFENSSIAVSEAAKALSVGMCSKGILNNYTVALDLQNTVSNSLDLLQKESVLTFDQVNKINSDFLAPISGAIADIGLSAVNANKLFNDGLVGKGAFETLQKLSDVSLDAIKEQQNFFISDLQKITNLGSLNTNLISSAQMLATGLDTTTRAVPIFPSGIDLPALNAVRENSFFTEDEISKEHDKLDDILKKMDPDLVEIRQGCWKTFNAEGSDYIRQASSSMRGLVDDILRIIAPKEDVVKTNYFKEFSEAKTEKGFPTRRAKIYYAVGYERKKGERLQRIVKGFLEIYDNLSSWDHKPIKKHEFVRGTFIMIEGSLIALLSEIEKRD